MCPIIANLGLRPCDHPFDRRFDHPLPLLAPLAPLAQFPDRISHVTDALFESTIKSLPLLGRGKVRDIYAVGSDKLLIVTSDRLSAFDVVLPDPIPGKGRLLTQLASFWFAKLAAIVPNQLTGIAPETVVAADERAQVRGRALVVKRLRALPIEAVVRGYLIGSGWKDYQASGAVCGIPLPPGLRLASRLPEPIFTPATKAASPWAKLLSRPAKELPPLVGPPKPSCRSQPPSCTVARRSPVPEVISLATSRKARP